jgi:hypothetical protein
MDSTTVPSEKTRRLTPSRTHVGRALEVALCLRCNGPAATLAWCAAGMPDDGVDPEMVDAFQIARRLIRRNGGRVKPGDQDRVLSALKRNRGARKK